MRARRDSQPASLEVQALYSIAALARVGNVSIDLMRRVLRANGVSFVRARRALFVPLTEIQRKIPPLWESLCAAAEMRLGRSEVDRPARGSPT
jgi:hypothetical protein